jgi:hypothetical protein
MMSSSYGNPESVQIYDFISTLTDIEVTKQILVIITGKLAALI